MGRIVVYCQPGAKRTGMTGFHDGKPKIQLKAPPIDGEANRALIRYVAELCGVAISTVRITLGTSGRTKRIEVDSLTDAQLAGFLILPTAPENPEARSARRTAQRN